MLGACQVVEFPPYNTQPDPVAAVSGADRLAEDSPPKLTQETPPAANDIVLAAAMPGDDDDLDPDYSAKQILVEAEPTVDADSLLVVETDLWQRIRDGFSLEHHLDEARVQKCQPSGLLEPSCRPRQSILISYCRSTGATPDAHGNGIATHR